jgi:threonine/homoserine/homoserine lactone efflux protein
VNFLTLLPMAFVMIAGPQILSVIFLATSGNWRQNCAAYIAGAALSITLVVTVAFFLLDGVSDRTSNDTVYVVVLVLLLGAMVHTFLTRKTAEPPKWMGRLQTATPAFSFKLGFLLLGVFPTDILTSLAVGSYLAAHGDPWWHYLPFVALTLLLLASPALLLLAFGERAERFLPRVREWMHTNSWVVNEIVILLFVGLTISNLAE